MLWLYLALSLSISALFYTGWIWWTNSRSPLARRVSLRLEHSADQRVLSEQQIDRRKVLMQLRTEDDSQLDVVLSPWMYQAGLSMRRPRHYLFLHLYFTSLFALTLALARGVDLTWVVVVLLFAVLPAAVVYWLSERKRRLLEARLPDLIDDMVAALQAGQTLNTLWADLARHTNTALSDAIMQMDKRLSFGESMDRALQAWAQKTTSADLRFFIAALRLHHQSGGNPIEVLKAQATLLREKLEMQRSIQASTSEARLSAWILALVPVVVAAVLAIFSPQQMGLLLTDSRGQLLLRGAAIFETAGVLWLWFLLRTRS